MIRQMHYGSKYKGLKGGSELQIYKRSFIGLFLISIILLNACNSGSVRMEEVVEDGLIINSISVGLGGNEDLDTTVVSYNFNLWNRTDKSIVIKTVEPILTAELRDRLTDTNIQLDINREINKNSSEALSGTFMLNTKGLDKEGIMDLKINVKEFTVTTEQVIGVYRENG
ncbi:hypothetical protein [Cohnella cellulosilytica]|uniref:Uncharacterized protein n=1 Tax=Cohnella cellulosilytica TaxID=986710 RepID=A0ABW2FKY1_9BACL